MTIRAVIWIILFSAGALWSFSHPIYGLYAYFLDYYAHPPIRWWGKSLPDFRWSFFISIILLATFLLKRRSLPRLEVKRPPQLTMMAFFILNAVFVSQTQAVDPDSSWRFTFMLSKFGMLFFLITQVVRTKKHFRGLILVQILGIFLWGWNTYQNPRKKAGRLYGMGGVDSYSDNGMAAVLIAIMPFIGAFFWEGKKWEKVICIMAAPLVLNAFILCNSRGAFLGLLVSAMAAIMFSKGSLRKKILLTALPASILFMSLMDPAFIARIQTIENYQEDGSASQRVTSWKGGMELIQDYPLGTGGGGFETLSPIYIPDIVEDHGGANRNVHSTYIQLASEWGIVGLLLFMGMLITSIIQLHKIRRTPPSTDDERQIFADSLAIELGIIGSMTAGIFTGRIYGESTYWLPAFAAALTNVHAVEKKKTQNAADLSSLIDQGITDTRPSVKED